MLLARSNWYDEARISGDHRLDLHWKKLLDAKRSIDGQRNNWGVWRQSRRRGIVYGASGPYVITVLSWNLPDYGGN